MINGPTKGATEPGAAGKWQSAPYLAFGIRVFAFLAPLVSALVAVRVLSGLLLRPAGLSGTMLWMIEAGVIGTAVSLLVDRATRRLLPLAALFGMSLVFPDQAPGRFSTALRAGTVRRMQANLDEVRNHGLGSSEGEAALRAIELVSCLGNHDRLTRGHTERVRAYADLIAIELGLSAADQARLSWGVLLHDIGKLSVPSEILNSPERPTEQEWQILRNHPEASREMLEPLADWLGEWIGAAAEHHERWDGNGYPRGLAGTDISLAGRIASVADAYDVITSKRSYKEPMSAEAARKELVDNAGSQFDPTIVRAFLNVSLGRRWMVGPFAWLADIPFGQIATTVTTAPAVAAVGAVTAAVSLAALPVIEPAAEPPSLAFTAPATETTTSSTAPALTSSSVAPAVGLAEPTTTGSSSTTSLPLDAAPTSATSSTSAPTSTSSPGPTSSTTPTTTTTSAPTTTTTTTTAPTTTTTTTAPPTTTTTTAPPATTTTTSPVVGSIYYLKNPGTGNSSAQTFKTLEGSGVDDATQPNFDTDRDSVAGLRLETTGSGWSESDLHQIQRYGMDPGSDDLDGPAKVTLYAAADSDVGGSPVTLRVALADCNIWYLSCTNLAESSVSVSNELGVDGFNQYVVDFGSVNRNFGSFRRMVVLLIAEGGTTLHTAFDSTPYPAVLDVTWN